jgi:hypothetical protein
VAGGDERKNQKTALLEARNACVCSGFPVSLWQNNKVNPMADPQNFIDRMLETENLSEYLEDEDADYLINWGVAQLKENIGKIEDINAAGEYTNDLMGFMRILNQIAGNLDNIQQDKLVQLAGRRQKAFGPGRELAPEEYGAVTSCLEAMTPRQALDYLLQWLLP